MVLKCLEKINFLKCYVIWKKGDTLYINIKENNIETDAYLATALWKNILNQLVNVSFFSTRINIKCYMSTESHR